MAITLDGTNGITNSSWTTATRPASPSAGQMGFNTTTGSSTTYCGGGGGSNGTAAGAGGTGGGGNGGLNTAALKGRKNPAVSKALTGKKLSEETKLKIGKASKGRVFSPEAKEKIRQAALKQWARQKQQPAEE